MENAKRQREDDKENDVGHKIRARSTPQSALSPLSSATDSVPTHRARQETAVVPKPQPAVKATTGKVFHVIDNDELKRLVDNDGEDPMKDDSIIFLLHAHWSRQRLQDVVDNFHLHSDVSAVTIFTVDVDAVDDAGELLHITTFPLPVAVIMHYDHEGKPEKKAEKRIEMPSQLHSISLVKPIHGIDHFAMRLKEAGTKCGSETYTLVYFGATWCPPCMRILEHLPEMIPQLPKSVVNFVKADKDTTQPLFDFAEVEKIPTFQVWKNTDSLALEGEKSKPVASLQSSNPVSVTSMIERHCATLSFGMDDDF